MFKLTRYWLTDRLSIDTQLSNDWDLTNSQLIYNLYNVVDQYTTESIAVDMSTDTMNIIKWTIGRYSTHISTRTRSSIDWYSVKYRLLCWPIYMYQPMYWWKFQSRPRIRYMIQMSYSLGVQYTKYRRRLIQLWSHLFFHFKAISLKSTTSFISADLNS